MARRKYRGIDIESSHIDMAKNLDSVHDLIDELRDLQSTWNNLSLLGELTNIGAEISDTRQHFQSLANDLSNFLVEQATRQAVEQLSARAQNSIDILVRNLYERTADIGFLATDPVFRQCCVDALNKLINEDQLQSIRERMQSYIANYSVYKNVILLDAETCVITDLTSEIRTGMKIPWIRQQVMSGTQFAEAYRPLIDDKPNQPNELVYAWKIVSDGQIRGFIVLVFNLEEEADALFSKVVGQRENDYDPEWRVCGVTTAEGHVLISSNPQYISSDETIRLPEKPGWGITQIGPVAYLGCLQNTRGYQGYSGPGWKGFCLVPLNQAFNQTPQESGPSIKLDDLKGLIDHRIEGFQNQATQIQKQLNRSIWNGNMTQRNTNSSLGSSFSKTLLWEISRAGERTKTLFSDSLRNLVQAEISGMQNEQQTHAMLAIDLMDRNLYERANDCRWWALNPTLIQALRDTNNHEAILKATECLKHIHSLYTVYTNILLLDQSGQVVCDSATLTPVGSKIDEPWINQALHLKCPKEYCVSSFENTTLYQDRPTYIYAAALFDPTAKNPRALGAIALVFDSEPQFEAILNESMGDNLGKAFAFIVDEEHKVISSTTNQYIDEGKLTLPLQKSSAFQKGKTSLGYFSMADRLIAYGVCQSGSYREYKSELDSYQNNLICLYGLDIGPAKQNDEIKLEISFDEFRQNNSSEQMIEVATFRIGQHWYGIDSEDVSEAFLGKQIASMPNSPNWMLGTTLHKKKAVNIIDVASVIDYKQENLDNALKRQQLILLKTHETKPCIAFAVDELGEIPNLPMSAIHESNSLNGNSNMVQGLIKTKDNLLILLNVEQLLLQLEKRAEETT
jgi:chemotaxis signal transduction protein